MSAKVVLLCEDHQTDSFVRRFLRHRNIRHRDVFTKPLPHGAQSGEQWVRTQFPKELKVIRAQRGAWLLVVIDADTRTTKATQDWLDAECRSRGVAARTGDDPVIVAVPKRNIETWFAFLKTDETPSEDRRYPHFKRIRDCRPLADKLFRMCHEEQRLSPAAPPSLVDACVEYRRFNPRRDGPGERGRLARTR